MYITREQKFHELTALQNFTTSTTVGNFLCDCGQVVSKIAFRVVAGEAKRCVGKNHNFSINHRPEYGAWDAMIRRCTEPNHSSFVNYGGRGIVVSDDWLSFMNFFKDMGQRPNNCELDRIDNDGPYSKNNCRWVSRSQNNRNKRTNRLLTVFGETKCCADWLEDSRCAAQNKKTLEKRLRLGWTDEEAVTKPQKGLMK